MTHLIQKYDTHSMEIQMELQLVFDESISSNQLDPDTRKLHQKKWREKNPPKNKKQAGAFLRIQFL